MAICGFRGSSCEVANKLAETLHRSSGRMDKLFFPFYRVMLTVLSLQREAVYLIE